MNLVKTTFLLSLLFATVVLFGQKIVINGKEGNRLLQWSDFAGREDINSSFLAYISYNTKVKFDDVQLDGNKATIKGFEMALNFDADRSWVKSGKETGELLKHEQGHFDIGILYMQEVLQKMDTASFTRSNFQQEFRKLVNDTHQKYKEMGFKYDSETNHSIKKDEEEKWNTFFNERAKR